MSKVLPPPPFTIKQLRDAVPSHLFERSALRSSMYLGADLLVVGIFFFVATYFTLAPFWLQMILWPIYWILQGCVMTGVWVIAHECGHQSFSDWKVVNNTVGLIFHSLLLVPYHSWRISHGMHHKGTAHMERDQVFVPALRSKVLESNKLKDVSELIEVTPLGNLIGIILMELVGWPGYLIFNASGQNYKRRTNHFEPDSPIFKKSTKYRCYYERYWTCNNRHHSLLLQLDLFFCNCGQILLYPLSLGQFLACYYYLFATYTQRYSPLSRRRVEFHSRCCGYY